jgi:hypothetical protein
MSDIVFDLEQRIMDCWNVTNDIEVVYYQMLDRPTPLTEDEIANVLLGLKALYEMKFERLHNAFEDVCKHGGIFLEEDLVTVAKQHRDYNEKLETMFDDDDNHISEPPDEYNNETQKDIDTDWERYEKINSDEDKQHNLDKYHERLKKWDV